MGAKVMKFRDGYLISTGEPKKHYIQEATRHVLMRQGVLGVKVKIMRIYDAEGKRGTKVYMPDQITIHEPKEAPPVQNMAQEDYVDEDVAVEENVQQDEQAYVEEAPQE